MNGSVLSVPMLQTLGYSLEESQVLLCLLDNGLGTIDELESKTKLITTVIQNTLQKLQDEGLVELIDIEPTTYVVTPKFAGKSASQTEELYKLFIAQIEAIVSRERDILDEIKNIFMSLGYVIKAPLTEPGALRAPSRLRRVGLTYDFIAESYYRIGVMLLNQDKWLLLQERLPSRLMITQLTSSLEQQNNCLTSFIFLGVDVQRPEEAIQALNEIRMRTSRWSRERGIENQAFYTVSVFPDMEGQVKSLAGEIRQKRKIVESVYTEIETALAEVDDMVAGIETTSSFLDKLLFGEEPFTRFLPDIGEIAEPVQSALSREMRNHRLFRRQYEEERIQIRRWRDAFESRVYLPEIDSVQDYLKRIQALKEKFLPIRFELRLYNEFVFTSMREKERKWNPFMFTEPYEPEGITINQEALKKQAQKFANSIRDGLPGNINFVMGSTGMGKTHMLKYVYVPLLRENDIWPIYVDCPVKYDLVKSVCQEILQDRNFPEEVLGYLPGLRDKDYSTTQDVIDLILRINSLVVRTNNARGVVLLLDELENTVPYRYYTVPDVKQRLEEEPLALRQLREILQHDYRERIGFVIAFRKQALPMVEQSLRMTNFRAFVREPKQLGLKDVRELILHRYKTWSAKEIRFSDECLKGIVEITEGVTRDIIKYCRELYSYAIGKKHKRITRRTLQQVGTIPLFKY